jgi:hypothetical protein
MDYFEAALKARAYIQTTAQHGPSKQLLDFINYDGNLYTDLGLESLGLETMSLTTQHEIVLSKLNPNDLDRLGMEGLIDLVFNRSKKTSDRITEVKKELNTESIGHLLIHDILNKEVKPSEKEGSVQIDSYAMFLHYLSSCEYNLKLKTIWLTDIPSDFNESTWDHYYQTNDSKLDAVIDNYEDLAVRYAEKHNQSIHHGEFVHDKSGWSPSRFKAGVKSWIGIINEEADMLHKLTDRLQTIKHWLETDGSEPENRKTASIINKHINLSGKAAMKEDNMISDTKDILVDASKMFYIVSDHHQ